MIKFLIQSFKLDNIFKKKLYQNLKVNIPLVFRPGNISKKKLYQN